jgi:hypothetical protein
VSANTDCHSINAVADNLSNSKKGRSYIYSINIEMKDAEFDSNLQNFFATNANQLSLENFNLKL